MTTTIKDALLEVDGEDEASVQQIIHVLSIHGFHCDTDPASGAFMGLTDRIMVVNMPQLSARHAATIVRAQKMERICRGRSLPPES